MNNESMVMRGGRVVFSAVLAATLVAGTAGVAPVSVASAATVSDSTYGTLDTADLPNGTYTVDVALKSADNIANDSMASAAFSGTQTLTVKNGSYTLTQKLGTVSAMGITGHVTGLKYYKSFSQSGSAMKGSNAVSVSVSGSQADIPLVKPESDYALIALQSSDSPMKEDYADAALFIDWDSLQVVSIDDPSVVDTSALEAAVEKGQALVDAGKASDELTAAMSEAAAVLEDASATQDQVDAALSKLQAALGEDESSEDPSNEAATSTDASQNNNGDGNGLSAQSEINDEGFQVGHVYAVPIMFAKEGTSQTSMANQYFGDVALVRPQSDGTYTVSFSTNRPDYIEGLSSSAGKVSITNEGSSSRQYTMTVPATESDAVYGVTMTIVPMKELGGGPVSADMHIYYSQAVDKGGDTGQIATSSKDSGVSTSGSVLPNTGDELPAGAVPAAAVLAVGAGAVAVAARRKMNEQ